MTSELCTSSVPGSQVTTTDCVSAQPGAASPSDTATVRVTGPGVLQTKLGVAELGSLNDPEVAVHEYVSGEGPPSASCAAIASATGKPTAASAEMPSATGQTLRLPLSATLPVLGGWWQSSVTETVVTACAVTLKLALPPHVVVPSVPVALSVIAYPLPAGRSPITADTEVLEPTLIVPDVEKLFGPRIV